MKAPLLRLVLLISFAILLLMAGVASAGPRGGGGIWQARRAAAAQQAQQAEQAREPHATTAQEVKPQAAPPAASQSFAPRQRTGALTAEERRALRRQIGDTAREVYRNPAH